MNFNVDPVIIKKDSLEKKKSIDILFDLCRNATNDDFIIHQIAYFRHETLQSAYCVGEITEDQAEALYVSFGIERKIRSERNVFEEQRYRGRISP